MIPFLKQSTILNYSNIIQYVDARFDRRQTPLISDGWSFCIKPLHYCRYEGWVICSLDLSTFFACSQMSTHPLMGWDQRLLIGRNVPRATLLLVQRFGGCSKFSWRILEGLSIKEVNKSVASTNIWSQPWSQNSSLLRRVYFSICLPTVKLKIYIITVNNKLSWNRTLIFVEIQTVLNEW